MKKYRIEVDKMSGFQTLRYQLEASEFVDDRVMDRAKSLRIQGLMQMQYIDSDGQRCFLANLPEFPTLNSYIQKELPKREVLTLLKNLSVTFSAGTQGIPVSCIVKSDDFIHVNPQNAQTICLLLPIKQGTMDVSEIPAFFRELISKMKFEESDRDNYVARLLTEINAYQFSLERFLRLVNDLMVTAAPESGAGKVNRMEVMRNRAASQMASGAQQATPYAQGMAPQQGMPPQGMPPQGMPPQGMPVRPGMPPQGAAPQGVPPQGAAPQGAPQQVCR